MPRKFKGPEGEYTPRPLDSYRTARGHLLEPGAPVFYLPEEGPGIAQPTEDGGPMVLAEILEHPTASGPWIEAVLNGGAYSSTADNLVPAEAVTVHANPGGGWHLQVGPLSDAGVDAEAEADAADLCPDCQRPRGGTCRCRWNQPRPLPRRGPARTPQPAPPTQPGRRDNRAPAGDPIRAAYDAALDQAAAGDGPEWARLARSDRVADLSALCAEAYSALEAIESGRWDPFLPMILRTVRTRSEAAWGQAMARIRAAGGDPDDPDDPRWADEARRWQPVSRWTVDHVAPGQGAVDDARATREHMRRWARGEHTHPGEEK